MQSQADAPPGGDGPMQAAAGALDRRQERRGLLSMPTVGWDTSSPGPGLRLTLSLLLVLGL